MAHKIAVLMGGRSLEREISLQSGARVVAALEARGHRVLALDLVPKLVDTLRTERPDAVYITLHGKFGEDGMIQELLEFLKIPYTGPGVLASMLAWDKDLTKRLFLTQGIPTPPWVAFSAEAIKDMGAARTLDLVGAEIGGFPVAVKPAEQGSALGLSRIENEGELAEAMLTALGYDTKVLVEKWIDGTEVAIPILDGPGGPVALPAVEIVPKQGLYDYESMYTQGETEYFVPARSARRRVRPRSRGCDSCLHLARLPRREPRRHGGRRGRHAVRAGVQHVARAHGDVGSRDERRVGGHQLRGVRGPDDLGGSGAGVAAATPASRPWPPRYRRAGCGPG